jgi:hypothetical protein
VADGVGESRKGEIVTASPLGVPIGTALIASPARRRAISLPPRAAGLLSLPRSDARPTIDWIDARRSRVRIVGTLAVVGTG